MAPPIISGLPQTSSTRPNSHVFENIFLANSRWIPKSNILNTHHFVLSVLACLGWWKESLGSRGVCCGVTGLRQNSWLHLWYGSQKSGTTHFLSLNIRFLFMSHVNQSFSFHKQGLWLWRLSRKKKKKAGTQMVTLHNNVLTHWAVGRAVGWV